MNKARRKELEKALKMLEDAKEIIGFVQEEEQEAFDNMNEGLQQTETGQTIEQKASELEEAASSLEDIVESLEEVIGAVEEAAS